jgi:perosamine synthetase
MNLKDSQLKKLQQTEKIEMKKYPLFKVHVGPTALDKISTVFESGIINEGVEVTKLTHELRALLRADNLILVNSGTSALTLALILAGVGPGDEVVSTPMTCVATNTPIVSLGANIVWANVEPWNGMIDYADLLKNRITKKTKAVMVVAWAGSAPQLKYLYNVCKSRKIKLILDAAHAFGASFDGEPLHEYADYVCYSFQAIKHFTTGDGGALVCKSKTDYERSKSLKWFGLDRDRAKDEKGDWKGQQWDVDIVEAGYKFNMNNISAAIGLSQLPYIQSILDKHRHNARLYNSEFESFDKVNLCDWPDLEGSSYWVYTLLVSPNSSISRDELLKKLNDEGIMAGVVHVRNDNYTAFSKFKVDNLPGVDYFSTHQFSLPCGWWISEEDVKHVATRVKDILCTV